MKKTLSFLLSLFLVISILPVYKQHAYASASEPQVHVMLKNYLGNKTQISITPSGTYTTEDGKITLNNTTTYTLKLEQTKLKLFKGSTAILESGSFTLTPSNPDDYLMINDRKYKGSFEFIIETTNGSSYIRPINTIGMEEYLKGVVPSEMPASWNIEALKAQAIAARTYSWNYGGKTITDTISHQVYGGLSGSHPNSDKAVEATTGQVLKYNNKLIDAVYSASNGGLMESAKNVWGNDFAYLKSAADSYDTSYTWSFDVQKIQIDMEGKDLENPDTWWNNVSEKDSAIVSNLKTWLKNNGYKDKDIKIVFVPSLSFTNPSTTKRVSTGSISIQFYVKDMTDTNGKLILQEINQSNVAASKVRAMIGLNYVKSYLVTKSSSNTTTHSIAGRGYGHGVGLSQYGANNRANAGQKYTTILAFYYPGTQLITEYTDSEIAAPEIKDMKASFTNSNNAVNLSFTLTKAASTIVRIKDTTGKIKTTILDNDSLNAGSYTYTVNTSTWADGNYTAEIIATDNNNIQTTSTATVKIAKLDTPTISSIKTTFDTNTNTVHASFSVNQPSKASMTITDSKNKVVKTLASSKALSAGSSSFSWDVGNVNDGTYTLNISAVNSIGKEKVVKQAFTIKKASAPTIKNVKTSYDTTSNKVKVSFHVIQSTKETVKIMNSKNKVVKTLTSNKSLKAGTHSYTWSVGNSSDGSYTVSVESVNSNNLKKTVKQKFTLKKVSAPTIKDVKTSYDTSSNKIKVSFHVNQSTKATVKIKNSKNKVVKTLTSNKSLKAGTHSYTWSVGKTSDGSYKAYVETVNSSKLKKTATKNFTLYKVKKGTVKATKLNIRQKPTTSSKIVGSVPNKKTIKIYAKSGSWYKIKYGKVTGYVSAKYVKNVK
ncbi:MULTISPECIES: SpoIID/LytB domain-containing protein [Bacillaceae]|uniref:SpoIID/LytB domain-containing protein n=1 Tax=Niallia hominis TaxID=3133173 RepID=A0ABV1EVP1_9BACI|nr:MULTISPECIES: SpoIID/LytB domain-containing protein [unclassified Bacillus (in: firmicutes)]